MLTIFWITLIILLIFKLYQTTLELQHLKAENTIYKQTIDRYTSYAEDKKNFIKEFKKARHDFKNQLFLFLQLLNENKYDELEENLQCILDQKVLRHTTIAATITPVIDALIHYKHAAAQNNGISFDLVLQIPSKLPFLDTDLSLILGNALDNAIEANNRSSIKNKYIKLYLKMDHGNLIIIVKNSFDGTIKHQGNKITTLKKDYKNHGIGFKTMNDVVKKYHGYIKIKNTDQEFILSILLYAPE